MQYLPMLGDCMAHAAAVMGELPLTCRLSSGAGGMRLTRTVAGRVTYHFPATDLLRRWQLFVHMPGCSLDDGAYISTAAQLVAITCVIF